MLRHILNWVACPFFGLLTNNIKCYHLQGAGNLVHRAAQFIVHMWDDYGKTENSFKSIAGTRIVT